MSPETLSSLISDLYDCASDAERSPGVMTRYVGKGMRPADIAEMLGVSSDTVKSHLARTFFKTGTGSQTALLQVVAGLAPAFHGQG